MLEQSTAYVILALSTWDSSVGAGRKENFASIKVYIMCGPEERKAFSRRTEDLLCEGAEGAQESSVCGWCCQDRCGTQLRARCWQRVLTADFYDSVYLSK